MATKSQTKSPTKGKKAIKSTGRKPSGRKTGISIRAAGKSLVIVESAAKARTVWQMMGATKRLRRSRGTGVIVPQIRLGVDADNGFQPSYGFMREKRVMTT